MLKRILSYFNRYKYAPVIAVIVTVLVSTAIFWLPFLLRATTWFGLSISNSNFLYIYRHYDGPLYAVVAKTLYNPLAIEKFILDISFDVKYFSAHLPLYPLLIRLFAPIFNYSKATVFVNIAATLMLAVFFYYLLRQFKLTKSPVLLTFVFLMLPRFLVVRSVGAPESLFILLILLSLFSFEKEKYILAGLFGGLATATKTPGLLLFFAYVLVIVERIYLQHREKKSIEIVTLLIRYAGLILIPLGLLAVFQLYAVQYKDFFAYFHSGDNIHLFSPFAVFNSASRWVGTGWLEDVLFYFFLYGLTVVSLRSFKHRSFFYFALVFFTATLFVQHRDISRYTLPLWPLACIGLEKFFTSRRFIVVLIILLPAIYLYAWNFSLQNVMPVSDWVDFFSR